jgi:membrane protein YdbS with pleckstrin-like domain
MANDLLRISDSGSLFIGLWCGATGLLPDNHNTIIGQLYKREKVAHSPTIGQLILLPYVLEYILMNQTIETNKLARAIEAMLEIIARILGLTIVYWLFELIGTRVIGDTFAPSMLLSLVVLPAIYVLKDAYKICEPFTVSVTKTDSDISVKMGCFTQKIDRLLIKNIDNIELTRTPLGRLCGYKTLYLYSAGGYLALPFLKDSHADKIESEIDLALKVNKGA